MKNSGPNSFPWREWTAAILWLILIAIESTPWLSFQNTGHVLYQLVSSLLGPVNEAGVTLANSVLREVGHVTGYGVLSWLLFRAWRVTLAPSRAVSWKLSWSVTAFFMTAAVASLDEWHQTFLPTRTGKIQDVFLDSAAALAVQVFLFMLLRKSRVGQLQEDTTVAVGH
ncbi:MAG TPA: VanZ family protein [Terriglobales bacterium]|nr:VanZ family protein [Terriglobales bacterium]